VQNQQNPRHAEEDLLGVLFYKQTYRRAHWRLQHASKRGRLITGAFNTATEQNAINRKTFPYKKEHPLPSEREAGVFLPREDLRQNVTSTTVWLGID